MYANSKIRVCEGGVLTIDGGTLNNADLELVPGCTLTIQNGGVINMASGKEFSVPLGAVFNLVNGSVN